MFKKFLHGFLSKTKSTITVGGIKYQGNNLTITREGDVLIDGELKFVASGPQVNVEIKGDINELTLDKGYVTIQGDVNSIETKSGDVKVGNDVFNGLHTVSGDVEIGGNVDGNVTTVSGDVEARKIVGFVKTVSGDIIS